MQGSEALQSASDTLVFEASGSQRTLHLATGQHDDRLEVRSPDGQIELAIRLTAEGPVLSLSANRLELRAADAVRVECSRFEVEASDGVYIRSQEMRVRTTGDVHLNGAFIRLNSPDGKPDNPYTQLAAEPDSSQGEPQA